jgi:hypothetical protein
MLARLTSALDCIGWRSAFKSWMNRKAKSGSRSD